MAETLRNKALDAHKANMERLLELCHSTLDSADRLAVLHLNTARALVEDVTSQMHEQFSGKAAPKPLVASAEAFSPLMEKAADYSRALFEIMAQVHERFDQIYQAQHADAHQHITSVLEEAQKSAPAGAEAAIAAAQSAVAATKKAHDGLTEAARRAIDLTKANVAKAIDHAEQSVKKTGTAKNKKNERSCG